MPAPIVKFVKTSEKAVKPTRGTRGAAGFDLYSPDCATIEPRGRTLISTDIHISLPQGTYGRIAACSGLAIKHGIDVGAGVIDQDYRGPIEVLLFNHSDSYYRVNVGDRIAQLICEYVSYPEFIQVDDLDNPIRERLNK